MRLKDRDLLARYIADRDMSQARLGRHADCSRQFIYKLVHGQSSTCTEKVAERIEEALQLLPGTLFERKESPAVGRPVKKTRTAA